MCPKAQGLRGTSYPGKTSEENHNPNGVVANVTRAPDEIGIAATSLVLFPIRHVPPRQASVCQPRVRGRNPFGIARNAIATFPFPSLARDVRHNPVCGCSRFATFTQRRPGHANLGRRPGRSALVFGAPVVKAGVLEVKSTGSVVKSSRPVSPVPPPGAKIHSSGMVLRSSALSLQPSALSFRVLVLNPRRPALNLRSSGSNPDT